MNEGIKMMLVTNLPLVQVGGCEQVHSPRAPLYPRAKSHLMFPSNIQTKNLSIWYENASGVLQMELKTVFILVPDKVGCLTSDHGTSHEKIGY